jgi:PAS domain S-box-containing protein
MTEVLAAKATERDTAHLVQFYEDDAVLMAEVAEFLDEGLRRGGVAIVIASSAHCVALRQQLMGFGAPKGQRRWFSGELIMLDAAEALARFMVDDWPDAQLFDASVGSVVRQACARGGTVHAFGEMVAVLCERGLYDAAVRLEQLWNTLSQSHRFSLFCAYPWRLFPTEAHTQAFQRVCCEHDHVGPVAPALPRERDSGVRTALLEQQNLALKNEVVRARESEETLRYRVRELADFVDNAAEGLHRVGPDGTILWANAAELSMLGYTWDEYVGHHIADFHADDDTIGVILARLKAGETLIDQPARLKCRDGSIKHVLISSNACFENGRLRYTRCFTRDATERHELELAHREREALVAELSEANRAKDEFLAMLAHELRNPLAPVAAAAELLALMADDPRRVRDAAAVITRQVGHMIGLIDDLLDVARVTRGLIELAKTPVDVRELVEVAVEQAGAQTRARRHHLTVDLPAVAAPVLADRKRIVQVIANIVANANKFTPEGGSIDVRLRLDADNVELTVADNGIGMEPELTARVFGLFVQGHRSLDRSQGGLGIGLSLAKSLVEAHGGTIRAASDGPGRGSCFSVCLPRLHEAVGDVHRAIVNAAPRPAEQGLRIAIVDDNRDAADALAGLLSAHGHEASALYASTAALEAARAACPQVFLLDIGLPEIDGFDLARRLRAMPEAAHAKLVAVTGYGRQQDRESTRAAGFDHHLVKPVDLAELLGILDAAA